MSVATLIQNEQNYYRRLERVLDHHQIEVIKGLRDIIKFAFSPAFGKAFAKTFDPAISVAAATHWWLAPSGGVDTIVPSIVAAVWSPVDAASLDASYLRLAGDMGNADIDPTVVGGVAPTWANGTGWVHNGSTQYLKSGFIPTNLNYSAFVQFSGSSTTGNYQGLLCAWNYFAVINTNNVNAVVLYYNGNGTGPIPNLWSGNLGFAGLQPYRNGSPDGAAIAGGGTVATFESYIGCFNLNPATFGFYKGNIQRIAVYKAVLTPTNVTNLTTAMADY